MFSMPVEYLKVQMQDNHSLDGFVSERLHFSYETHLSGVNYKVVVHEEYGDISEKFEIKYAIRRDKIGVIYLIKVQVQMIVGGNIKEDCSCDS